MNIRIGGSLGVRLDAGKRYTGAETTQLYQHTSHDVVNGKMTVWSTKFNTNTPAIFNITFTSNSITPTDLRLAALSQGWQVGTPIIATINSDVILSSNTTSAAALTIPAGITATVINNGQIIGMGGDGGDATTYGTVNPGGYGGPAITNNGSLTIVNNGTIGGGGGGAGSAYSMETAFKASSSTPVTYAGYGGLGGLTQSKHRDGVGVWTTTSPFDASGQVTTANIYPTGGLGSTAVSGPFFGTFLSTVNSYTVGPGGAGGAAVNGTGTVTWTATGARFGSYI